MSDSLQNVSRNLRVVSLCTVVSRIFGLLRDQAMGKLFGAGSVLDTFTVAFRLPNLARILLGEGALTTAFLPVVLEEQNERGRESATRVTWAVFLVLGMVLCGLVILVEIGLALLVALVPLSPESRLLCRLTALLLPYVILICLAAQLGAVLNALGQFVWPALVPVVLNVIWLAALWWVIPFWWLDPIHQIQATSVLVVLAGGLQLAFLMPFVWRCGFGYRSDWRIALPVVRRVARDMFPVVLGLSITQLNTVLDSIVAWGFAQPEGAGPLMPLPGNPAYPLEAGTATTLYLGQRLYQFPLGVFGVALGTVLFPLFTQHAQRGESEKLRSDLSLGIRLVLAIGLPASAGLMLVAHPLAKLFFQYGKFDAAAAVHTGDMIVCYGAGVWAYCGLLILQRAFYAIGDRLTPMYVGLCAMLVNLALNLTLIWPLGGRGLALSTALIAALQCGVTCLLLQRKIGQLLWRQIGSTGLRSLIAVAIMSGVCLCLIQSPAAGDGLKLRGLKLLVPLVAGTGSFFVAAWLLRLREPWMLLGKRTFTTESRRTR
ncbi:MAG: murein biosynthesis integral membrane protein MurJ [Planctomycetes bacterium]|nr:murein biosynthesis integral membrane protein MurJ [Planctomycetota bacterium]